MSSVSPLLIDRFKRVPRRSDETWQAGVVRLPTWIDDAGGGRYRLVAGLCVSLRSGRVHVKPADALRRPADLMVETLLEFAGKSSLAGCRAGRIELADSAIATDVTAALGDADLQIVVRDELPALRAVLADLAAGMESESPIPEALSGRGVTIDRMRRFADAAKAFYEAKPWRHLTNDDLIRVESPRIGDELSHVSVMGAGGREFGLAFLASRDDFDNLVSRQSPGESFRNRSHWSVSFGPIWELPFGDVDLFEDAQFPVASADAYPIAFEATLDEMSRPDAATLAYLEGVLRAIADSSEAELDRGRWTRTVVTADGGATYALALCDLVDQPRRSRRMPDRGGMESLLRGMAKTLADGKFERIEQANTALQKQFGGRAKQQARSPAKTSLETAQDLVEQAFDARGRRQLQLIRQAVAVCGDCADAYVLLAERTSDTDEAFDLYSQAMAAGERALGPGVFSEETGHFWGVVSTRPYMRARLGVAGMLQSRGRHDEAIGHYRELLRLNPNDNQGVREVLLPLLLELGRDAEAGELLSQYEDDGTALWTYARALWAFRVEGNSPSARKRLAEAVRTNRHGVKVLRADPALYDDAFDSYAFGSEEEAIVCARELSAAWRRTPGAIAWLKSTGRDGGKKAKFRR